EADLVRQLVIVVDEGIQGAGRVIGVLGTDGQAVGAELADPLVDVQAAGLRVGVGVPGQVVRQLLGDVGAIADVVVDLHVGAGEGRVVGGRGPGADVQAAFVGDVQAALHGASTVGLRLTAPDVIGSQGGGHADVELADRAFNAFSGSHAGE